VGIRETLNRNPGVTIGVIIALLIFVVIVIIRSLSGGSSGVTADDSGKNFYSTDDGASYYTDDVSKLAPYTKDGKQALRAYVFKCADGKMFVGFLERYTPKGLQMLTSKSGTVVGEDLITEVEVKKPRTGDTGWVKRIDARAAATIMQVRCPDGKPATPVTNE
jgi:hypothetical protein